MALDKVRVPDIGTEEKVDVVEVLVSVGDRVEVDDGLITLESDKATMDVPATSAGTVHEVKVKAGDRVGEGDVILLLEKSEEEVEEEAAEAEEKSVEESSGEEESEESADREAEKEEAADQAGEATSAGREAEAGAKSRATSRQGVPARDASGDTGAESVAALDYSNAYASPAVRRQARLLGVDLSLVQGTGRKNRILKEDVESYVKKTLSEGGPRGGFALPEMPVIDFSKFGEVERVELTRVQKISGPNLQRSWLHAPHVTQHDEADITDLEAFRQRHKGKAKEEGFNLTPLAFVMKTVVAVLAEFPRVNASLDADGEHVVLKKYYHLGVAVDTEDGLMVPVIRDVDEKGVMELARELAEVSARAREKKLKPDELRGASFTITSLGGIGGTFFTPIINVPEVAILGLSRAFRKPVWQDGEFVPRLMLPLSLSYDHRVIDGAMAVRFTTRLAELLADIRSLLL